MGIQRRMLLLVAAVAPWGGVGLHAAGGSTQAPPPASHETRKGAALSGSWGGEGISLEVTEAGARIEYDCAHGTVDRRIVPDARGRFDLPGTHVEEHGGPVRAAPAGGFPVRYAGRVDGSEMELTVTRAADGEVIGTYSLVRAREPSIVKCR
jgi:hypothetical protein